MNWPFSARDHSREQSLRESDRTKVVGGHDSLIDRQGCLDGESAMRNGRIMKHHIDPAVFSQHGFHDLRQRLQLGEVERDDVDGVTRFAARSYRFQRLFPASGENQSGARRRELERQCFADAR
jgi:hypothetical protein